MTSGVYQIRNKISGRIYIGSSARIERRWCGHQHDLRAGTHHSRILQRSWNKHGEDAFAFEILIILPTGVLIEYEQRLIDHFKPSMNIQPNASSPLGVKRSPETREKISAAKRGKQQPQLIKYSQKCIGKPAAHVSESNRRRKGTKTGPHTAERISNISLALKGKPNLKNRGVKKPWLAERNRLKAKLTEDQVMQIRKNYNRGDSAAIAKQFAISARHARDIIAGRRWQTFGAPLHK